jgi:hypothetical protein
VLAITICWASAAAATRFVKDFLASGGGVSGAIAACVWMCAHGAPGT